jgi:hypothetical protein
MNEAWLILEQPDSTPKLKSLQDLSIRINVKVTEEIVDHIGLWINGGKHLLYRVLESSNLLHRPFCLVRLITNIPLNGVIPVRVPRRGGGPCSMTELGRTMRTIGTTALLVLWVTTPILVSHWGYWGGACGVVVSCCAASMQAHYRVRGGPE